MWILAYFTKDNYPETGLSPTVRIIDLSDDSLIVNDDSMSEAGDGFYKYDFTSYSGTGNYAIRCDGGATLSGVERFTYAGNENFYEDISSAVWDIVPTQYQKEGSMGLQLMNLIRQNRMYNISLEEVRANTNIPSRKVRKGQISHIVYKIKNEDDIDWSNPVATGTLYAWYNSYGDSHPYYVGEEL